MTFFSLAAFIASTFLSRWASMKGPFFRLRDMAYLSPRAASAATTNNERVRCLGQTRTALGLTPRRDRVTAPRSLAFAPTEGVVDRVHRHAAGLGTDPLPAAAPGLADLDQFVFGVAHDAQPRATVNRPPAPL